MNLIICGSPLQVLIAEKIIDLYPTENFYGFLMSPLSSEKYKYYYKRLKKKCKKAIFIKTISLNKSCYFNWLKQYFYIERTFKKEKFHRIFVANINDIIVHNIIGIFHESEIYTFDDGTANIMKNGLFFNSPRGLKHRIFRKLFAVKCDMNQIKSRSLLHYTIYPNMENISKNLYAIDLNVIKTQGVKTDDENTVLLLGQPIFCDVNKNIKLMEKVIEMFNIEYYFPHPREQARIHNVKYIETPLIFEDYFAQNLSNKNCKIYCFFSSAILNIGKRDNIEVVSIKPNGLEENYYQVYELFEKIGIQILEINS